MIEEQPNLNTGEPWSEIDIADIKWQAKHKVPLPQIADFMCRTEKEIRDKTRELGLELLRSRGGPPRKRKLIRGTRKPIIN